MARFPFSYLLIAQSAYLSSLGHASVQQCLFRHPSAGMSLKKLIQQNQNASAVGFGVGPACVPHAEPGPQMDSRRLQHLASTVGTLPRGRKQVGHLAAHTALGARAGLPPTRGLLLSPPVPEGSPRAEWVLGLS